MRSRTLTRLGAAGPSPPSRGSTGPTPARLLRARALADDHVEVRAQAVNALSRSSGDRSINVLAQALHQDPELEVRINAVRALGRLGGDRARRILERAARDLDPDTAAAAERALAAKVLPGCFFSSIPPAAIALARLPPRSWRHPRNAANAGPEMGHLTDTEAALPVPS